MPTMDGRLYTPLCTAPEFDMPLLRLQLKSDRHASIECSPTFFPLIDVGECAHLYEALSYAWGDADDLVDIKIPQC